MYVQEKETLALLEELKYHYLQAAKVSCASLMMHLHNGLLSSNNFYEDFNSLHCSLQKASRYNELIDLFLDYFSEYGEPDTGSTEQFIQALVGYIKQEI